MLPTNSGDRTEFPVALPAEIKPDQFYHLASVTAPVLDERDQVAFLLGLLGFTDRTSGSNIEKMGRRLREAAA